MITTEANTPRAVVLVTENTNRLAEQLGYNIAGLIFLARLETPQGWRGYVIHNDRLEGVITLQRDDFKFIKRKAIRWTV